MSAVLSIALVPPVCPDACADWNRGFVCVPTTAQVLFSEGTKIHVIFFGALCILSAGFMFAARVAHLGWKLELRRPV